MVQTAAGVEGVLRPASEDKLRAKQRAAYAEPRALKDTRIGRRIAIVQKARALAVAPLDESNVFRRVYPQELGDSRRLLSLDAQPIRKKAERLEQLVALSV